MIKEVTRSDEYLIVGIDIGKDKHHAFMGSATGTSLYRKLVFQNDLESFSRLLKTVEQIKSQHGLSKVVFGVEPTGNYHKPLARYLIRSCHMVVMVTGQREEHGLRMRVRNNLLAQYFPELDRFYSACERESLAIVRWYLNPQTVAAFEFGEFFYLVTEKQRGIAQTQRLRKIHSLAEASVGCPVEPAIEYEARLVVEKLLQVRDQIKKTDGFIADICFHIPEYSYLMSIPGFGPYVSAVVSAVIGDPSRFGNRRQLIKMAGFDLSASRSGKTSNRAIPVISKKGNSELRYALYQAAQVAATRVDLFRAYYTRILKGREGERGIRTKMYVKLAAKMLVIAWTLMLVIAWTLMKRKESFNPAYLKTD
ncbi:MAG: transposase [Deltaproteobacteria bacterium]|nr:transposase [Deltaproteobacteria bacterium]